MNVLLVDDHAIVRQGLRSLLEDKAGVKVVGEAADGREALSLAESLAPELIIMDIAMPGLNGLEALLQLQAKFPQIKVIILSMHIEENYVKRALRSGASGFVYKGSAFDDLELAMKAVQKNEVFLSPAVSQILVNDLLQEPPAPEEQRFLNLLSAREREIMQLMAEGKSRTEIAELLAISVKTVDRHKENLKEKLYLTDEEEIVNVASRLGLTEV